MLVIMKDADGIERRINSNQVVEYYPSSTGTTVELRSGKTRYFTEKPATFDKLFLAKSLRRIVGERKAKAPSVN